MAVVHELMVITSIPLNLHQWGKNTLCALRAPGEVIKASSFSQGSNDERDIYCFVWFQGPKTASSDEEDLLKVINRKARDDNGNKGPRKYKSFSWRTHNLILTTPCLNFRHHLSYSASRGLECIAACIGREGWTWENWCLDSHWPEPACFCTVGGNGCRQNPQQQKMKQRFWGF